MLLIAASLFSGAQPDIQLEQVDTLIAERRINEALDLVEKYIRENPKDFDNAQKRVDIIFELRNNYKEKADELVKIIVEDPLNDKLKLDIIDELESMEANPNLEEREFIRNVKVTSQFTYFRALYEQIVQDGTELLAQKDYVGSAERFTDGFELYYEDFFESGYDEALIEEVLINLSTVNNSIRNYGTIQENLLTVFERYNAALAENNVASALSQYDDVVEALNTFANVRNESILAGFYFEEQSALLQQQNPELSDAFFLPFAFRLILGRGDDAEADITKAMDTQWEDLYEQTKVNLSSMLTYYSNDLNQSVQLSTISQIGGGAETITNKADLLQSITSMGEDFLSQYGLLNNSPTTFEENPHTEYQDLLIFTGQLIAKTNSLIENSALFVASRNELESYPLPDNPDTEIRNRDTSYSLFHVASSQTSTQYAQIAAAEILEMQEQKSTISSNETSFTVYENTLYQSAFVLSHTIETHFDSLITENYADALIAWETLAQNLREGSTLIEASYSRPYAAAIPLINEELDIAVVSNPANALITLESLLETIDQDINNLQLEYDFLSVRPEDTAIGLQNSSTYDADQASILEDISSLQEIQIASESYITLANQRLRLAQQAENEADLRFSQAQQFLDQENFTASRDAVQRARTKYNEALSYQYSEDLQTESDEQLAALGEEISFMENEIVVRNVRNFITQSRQNYYNSNFSQAEALILQAESQWALTNIQENPEIIALKALIGNALSITTGRSIPATDPLYPEMSQTLNVAYQHFSNAQNLLDRNNRNTALEELELARDKIRDVQVLYPFHQEASLLALQIDKLIDPVAFEEQFEQKFEQAQADYDKPDTSGRAYIDLLDLYEINPDYPGLEDFIYIVELELGIILPPPDLQALARSNTLTQQAEDIYDSGARDEISLNNALSLLNQAIDLNAENQDALILLDRINTSLGGAAVIVLSSEAENLYQQAVQELSNGNTITAAALVSQLMQLPGVQNSSKIIDLQRRVESLL